MPVPTLVTGQPHYEAYYQRCVAAGDEASVMDTLVSRRLPERHEKDSFLLPRRMYLVDDHRLFHGLHRHVAQFQKDAEAFLEGASTPSRVELDGIRFGEPLGLFSILRIHHAFIELSAPTSAAAPSHARLHGANLDRGLAPGSVVPSAHRFDRSRYQRLCERHKVTSKDVAACLVARGYPKSANVLLHELEVGYEPSRPRRFRKGSQSRQKRTGAYRVTEPLAVMIACAISDAAGAAEADEVSQKEALEYVFDTDPRQGPGKGGMTQALPLTVGNLLRVP